MFTTVVRIEHDLGVPSVSLNALTGHRSCAPEDCSGLVANPPQGSVPVSGVFPAGATLHLLETRLQAIRLSPYRADLPARHPVRLGMNCRFPGMLLSPTTLSGPGQPSDPETSPLVPARCAGDTTLRLVAQLQPPSPAPGQEPAATRLRRHHHGHDHRPDGGENTAEKGPRRADPRVRTGCMTAPAQP